MTVFQNKNLVKAILEKKNQGRKNRGKFRFRQKELRHRNRYLNLILVSKLKEEYKSYLNNGSFELTVELTDE